MTLNFGNNLFPPRGEQLVNYNFSDVLRGISYITFYCAGLWPKATVYESYEIGDDGDSIIGSNWIAQTFTVGNTGTNEDFYINGVEVFGSFDTNTKNIFIEIQETSAGEPNGTVIGRGGFSSELGATGDSWKRISLDHGIKLSASTQYAVILYKAPATNAWHWRTDTSSPTYTGGSFGSSADLGATWNMDTGKDLLFRILGDTKPFLTFMQDDLSNAPTATINNLENTDYTEILSQDIDIVIGKSAQLLGTVIIEIPIRSSSLGTETIVTGYYELELFKVVAGVETSLGTAETKGAQLISTGTTTLTSQIKISRTTIKEDDTLRLKIKLKEQNQGSTTSMEVDFSAITMRLSFKVDI